MDEVMRRITKRYFTHNPDTFKSSDDLLFDYGVHSAIQHLSQEPKGDVQESHVQYTQDLKWKAFRKEQEVRRQAAAEKAVDVPKS